MPQLCHGAQRWTALSQGEKWRQPVQVPSDTHRGASGVDGALRHNPLCRAISAIRASVAHWSRRREPGRTDHVVACSQRRCRRTSRTSRPTSPTDRRRARPLQRHQPRLFGSVARGDAVPGSDVDLLVDLDGGAGNPLMQVAGLSEGADHPARRPGRRRHRSAAPTRRLRYRWTRPRPPVRRDAGERFADITAAIERCRRYGERLDDPDELIAKMAYDAILRNPRRPSAAPSAACRRALWDEHG